MINLGSGTLYITNLDGSTTTLNNVLEISMTVEEDDKPEQIYIKKQISKHHSNALHVYLKKIFQL